MAVHSFTFTPPVRFDDVPWAQVRIEDSLGMGGTFSTVEVQDLPDPDADPAEPRSRNITTSASDLEAGYFRLVWIDGEGGVSPPSVVVYSPSAAPDGYPGVAALVGGSSVSELTGLPPADQAVLRVASITAVESFCRQSFTATEAIERVVQGNNLRNLYLPQRLASLTALTVNGRDVDLGGVKLDVDEGVLRFPLAFGQASVAARTIAQLEGDTQRSFSGDVGVTGVWGWPEEDFPAAVSAAITFDMEDTARAAGSEIGDTVAAYRALGISDVNQGDLSVALKGSVPALAPRAKRAVRDLRWRSVGALA